MITSPLVIRLASRLLRVVPVPVVRGLARVAGSVAFVAQGARRRAVLENLSYLAPEAGRNRRLLLARRTFRNIAMASVDLFRLPSARREDVLSLVASAGREHLDAATAMGKGVIVVTAHLGPYELGGAWAAAAGYPVHAMVEDLDQDVLDALASYRKATGMELVSMKQGIREVYRLLQAGRFVLLVSDRAIGDTRGTVVLPFGAGRRRFPTGPATFAMATGAPIVVGHIALNPEGHPRYLVSFEPPLLPAGRGDEERLRLTRRITERLAAAVRDHPDEWYVFQPQWVSSDRD